MQSKFYTNVTRYGNNILIREINELGHTKFKEEYMPTLFVPSDKPDIEWKGLYGEHLEPIKPGTMRDCKNFIEQYRDIEGFKVHGFDNYVAQWISDNYLGGVDYDLTKIRICDIDIEVAPPEGGGFPTPEEANGKITAITLYDSVSDHYFAWGIGHWSIANTELDFLTDDMITYVQCKTEIELVTHFVSHINQSNYDVWTGWNIEGFDIPYLVNRIRKVAGDTVCKKLSPWGRINEKKIKSSFGKERQSYEIVGVAVLDYLALYKKFTYSAQESYTLDHISYVELGEKKLDYSEAGSLHNLYLTNFQKYLDYNIKDVNLVKRLDDKMKLLDLVFTVAYYARVNFEDVFSPVRTWDAIIYNNLIQENVVIPPMVRKSKDSAFAGAYVKPPKIGFSDWVISLDLNSLYPHLIMQYNLGPDTIVSDPPLELSNISVDSIVNSDGKEEVDPTLVSAEKDLSLLKKHDLIMAANGTFYRKDVRGILPKLMDTLYIDRKKNKKMMLDWEQKKQDGHDKKECENNISKYDNIQMAMKILLNSAYGATGTPYFRYYDLRIAEAITLSGQLSIKWIANRLNEFFNKSLKTEDVDYVIAIDTDSNYIELGSLVDKALPPDTPKETIVNMLSKFVADVVEPYIKEQYDNLADYMNAYENKMVMEREVIADKGFWTAKKRYVLNVWDSEGVRYKEPKLKVMGLEAKKSSTPEICRNKLKELYKLMVTSNEAEVQQFIAKFREEWSSLDVDAIASPSSCNGISKYADAGTVYVKGTPMHVKGSLVFNHILADKGMDKDIQPIADGDKIKYVPLKVPNPAPADVVSFSGHLPEELGLTKYVNYKAQFEKAFLSPARGCLDAVGWSDVKKVSLLSFT